MPRRAPLLAVLLTIVAPGSPAKADEAMFEAYLGRPATHAAVAAAVRRQADRLPGLCKDVKLGAADVAVVQAPKFKAGGRLESGLFKLAIAAEACGARMTFNIWTIAKPGSEPMVFAAFPGGSLADPLLQRDGFPIAVAAALFVPANCADVQVTGTAFVAFEGEAVATAPATAQTRPWREDWTMSACGVTGAVAMHFRPDATGTAIRATPGETSRR